MTTIATTRHTEATRNAILGATVDLFLERKSDGFSVQEVADRAGLTHRTVYRYFPTRQELLAATAQHIAPDIAEEPITVSTVEEWIDAVGAHFALIEANFQIVRSVLAAVLASDDLRLFGQGFDARDTHHREVFRRQFPRIPEPDARRTFATLRQLMSSVSYVFYRLRFGLSPAEATLAIRSAASQIVEQAARRDRAAAHGRRR